MNPARSSVPWTWPGARRSVRDSWAPGSAFSRRPPHGRVRSCRGKTGRQHDATRLLEMPPIVRDHEPQTVQYAVGDDVNEGRRHDDASRMAFVERSHPPDRVDVLLDETRDDVGGDGAAGRLRLRGGLELSKGTPNYDLKCRRNGSGLGPAEADSMRGSG